MSYKALYRVYRPQSFFEVAGQKHITRTFQNALKNSKLAHAYLFSGPRGTGKTSIAKIIAKAINCEKAPAANPCNECKNCIEITKGMLSDVIEIDAASNNGVDEIRELRDKVKFLPSVTQYKVYIIDEVHMLSTGAFNALLKTLEEPPRHVIFILATTEPHKIPKTIHSRCQRFDFREISVDEIVARMNLVLDSENIKVSNEALNLIAHTAEGGMRDALSLLDQAISFSENNVEVDDVLEIIGSISHNLIIDFTKNILNYKTADALKLFGKMLKDGKEAPRIVINLINFYKELMIYKSTGEKFNSSFLGYQETIDFANEIELKFLFKFIKRLNNVLHDMKRSINKNILLEMYIISESTKKDGFDMNTLVSKVKELEEQMKNINTNGVSINTVESNNETVINDVQNNKVEEIKEIKKELLFDIALVERILKNGDKERKNKLIKKWDEIQYENSLEFINISKLLSQTVVEAYAEREIVLSTSSYSICNMLMNKKTMKVVQNLFEKMFKVRFNYIILPNEVWLEKRNEFVSKWKAGDKNPKLSPVVHKDLILEVEVSEKENKIISKARELFGEDIEIKGD